MMMTLPHAIARKEGFYVHDSRAARNNNPGNLEFGTFAAAHGATEGDGRFAIFPTPEAGFTALEELLKYSYGHLTIEQAIKKYAPANENDTASYIADVCHWTGLKDTDLVGTALEETTL